MSGYPLTTWDSLAASAPVMTATMRRYLDQIACSLRPSSVLAADRDLRTFGTYLQHAHPDVTAIAQLHRTHPEGYKRWLTDRPQQQAPLSATSRALRLGALRIFFTRTIEWDWDDAPTRPMLFHGDLPTRDAVLPKAIDDTAAGTFLRTAQANRVCSPESSPKSSSAPDYASGSSATYGPTRSAPATTATGCTSRSASSTMTATCRCTPPW